MNLNSNCMRCGCTAPLQHSTFREMYGLLVLLQTRIIAGEFCQKCTRVQFWRAMAINCTIGLLSIPSIVTAPIVLIVNIRAHRRAMKRFAGGDTSSESVRKLPWALQIGDANTDISRQPLTLASGTFALFAVFAGFWLLFLALGLIFTAVDKVGDHSEEPIERRQHTEKVQAQNFRVMGYTAPFIFGGLALAWFWKWRSQNPPGEVRDVLIETFPGGVLLQGERVHFAALGWQRGPMYRLMVTAQNLYATPSTMQLSLAGDLSGPQLTMSIPAAGVGIAYLDLPLAPIAHPQPVSLAVSVSSFGNPGERVRSKRRTAMTNINREHLTNAAMLVGGHYSFQNQSPPQPLPTFVDRFGVVRTLLLPAQPVVRANATPPALPRWFTRTMDGPNVTGDVLATAMLPVVSDDV